jgi:hypothetical protein
MSRERVVAVGLLTQANLDSLGPTLNRVWPVEQAPCFLELLEAIDAADGGRRAGLINEPARL